LLLIFFLFKAEWKTFWADTSVLALEERVNCVS
jgi:hypothetical protein